MLPVPILTHVGPRAPVKSGAGLIKVSPAPLPAPPDTAVAHCRCLFPQTPPPFIPCQPSNRLRDSPRAAPSPPWPHMSCDTQTLTSSPGFVQWLRQNSHLPTIRGSCCPSSPLHHGQSIIKQQSDKAAAGEASPSTK